MNSSKLFVLGLLLLTANLSLGALFSPARAGRAEADRLLLLWKLLLLAAIQIGAWAIVLHQGGAAPTLAASFTRSAACFALIGGSGGGLAFPWGEIAPFIALNGLLFIPVALLPLLRGSAASSELEGVPLAAPVSPSSQEEAVSGTPLAQNPAPQKVSGAAVASAPATEAAEFSKASAAHTAPVATESRRGAAPPASFGGAQLKAAKPEKDVPEGSAAPVSNAAIAANPAGPELQRGGLRPTIPKAHPPNPQLTPEEELLEQMKPIGPTPPPIRFQWKN